MAKKLQGIPCVHCHRKSRNTILYVDEQEVTGKVVASQGPYCSYKCMIESLVGSKPNG